MFKGWKLVSLYCDHGKSGQIFIDFAHYTGKPGIHGGSDYDKTLSGYISEDDLRKVLKSRLNLGLGYSGRERI